MHVTVAPSSFHLRALLVLSLGTCLGNKLLEEVGEFMVCLRIIIHVCDESNCIFHDVFTTFYQNL